MAGLEGRARLAVSLEARQPVGRSNWADYHRLFVLDLERRQAVAMQVGVRNSEGHNVASFHCCVFRRGELPVVIVDREIPFPEQRLELRTSGLWTDNICETPFLHWSYGLEAFALEIDEPSEMLERGYGQRVPLGWEFEFESSVDRVEFDGQPPPDGAVPAGAYSQRGYVHGLLLFAGGDQPLGGTAVRQHWWGPSREAPLDWLDSTAASVLAPGTANTADAASNTADAASNTADAASSTTVALPVDDAVWWLSYDRAALVGRTERPD